MDLHNAPNILTALDAVSELLDGWGLQWPDWCLLDGPAIKLHDNSFDSTAWRDHLNIYVSEEALPWKTSEMEQTVPPLGSAALAELLQLGRQGNHIHLVPAARYYRAGFDRNLFRLRSGRLAQAASLLGCSQVWSYKSVEVIHRWDDFIGDVDRIVHERLERLRIASASADNDSEVRHRIELLTRGYKALLEDEREEANVHFVNAAGPNWVCAKC